MKKALLTILILLLGSAAMQAQGTKAERMKYIRKVYAEAKQKIEKDAKAAVPRNVIITLHNQEDGDSPLVTTEVKCFLERLPTFEDHCYFISTRTRSAVADNYHEYLFAQRTHDLIFSFGQYKEGGSKNELRFYFDESGSCIERKATIQPEEGYDDSMDERLTATRYITVIEELID